jgi:uncharacterized protein YacL
MMKNIEFNIFLFGFLLNAVWEMLQMPLFSFSSEASLWEISLFCMRASLGDAFMLIIMYWLTAAFFQYRDWINNSKANQVALFIVIGVVMTIVFEALATGPLQRWEYNELMPTLPILGTGVAPLLQWLLIPPLVLWIVRRQIQARISRDI